MDHKPSTFTFVSSYRTFMHGMPYITEERIEISHNGTIKITHTKQDESDRETVSTNEFKLNDIDLKAFSELLSATTLDEFKDYYPDAGDGPQANHSVKRILEIEINGKRKKIVFDGWAHIPDGLTDLINMSGNLAIKRN